MQNELKFYCEILKKDSSLFREGIRAEGCGDNYKKTVKMTFGDDAVCSVSGNRAGWRDAASRAEKTVSEK